jgi:GNAT superfamily N-acetyltransferase
MPLLSIHQSKGDTIASEIMQRLDKECEDAFDKLDPKAGRNWVKFVTEGKATGKMSVSYWANPGGTICGYVAWETIPGVGRRVNLLFLDNAHQTTSDLRSLLEDLGETDKTDGPVFAIFPDGMPGFYKERQALIFGPAGFVHFDRVTMVFPKDKRVPAATELTGWEFRHPLPEDETEIIDLACRAYCNYEEQLVWPMVNLEQDQAAWVNYIRDEETVVREACFVLVAGEKIRGHVTVIRGPDGPYIANIMVDPSWQGKGIGKALLIRALRVLRADGAEEDVQLFYIRQNVPAGVLYRSVGFVQAPRRPTIWGGSWLKKETIDKVLKSSTNAKYR